MKHEFRYFLVLSSLAVALTLAATWLSAAASTVPGSSGNAGEDWSDPGSAATPFIPSRLNPAAPSGRANHSLTQVGSSLYLFGGGSITSTGGTMNDLWRFDAASNAWVRVEPGAGPSARKGHAAANLGGQLYILGGEDNSGGKLDDVWRYDPASGKWYEVAQDTRPPARSQHTASTINNQLHVYGGAMSTPVQPTSLWKFDPITGYWSIESIMENPQGERRQHTAGLIGGKLYLVGGTGSSGADFVQTYDLSIRDWASITTTASSPRPAMRYNHAGAFGGPAGTEQIYIFGGTSITTSRPLKDAWRFDLQTHAWVQLPDLPGALTGARAASITSTIDSRAMPLGEISEILITGGINNEGVPNATSYIFDGITYQPVLPPVRPTVQIDSHPPTLTNSLTASFTFSGAGPLLPLTFQCSLDGAAFAACTSPHACSGLAEGSHTFQVRSVDPSSNQSDPAAFTWNVDATAPAAPAVTSPANGSVVPLQPGDYRRPRFSGTAEAGALVSLARPGSSRLAADVPICSATANAQGQWSCQPAADLPAGRNQATVVARDAAGNLSPATSLEFIILTVLNLPVATR